MSSEESLSLTFGAPSIERDGPFGVSQRFLTLVGNISTVTLPFVSIRTTLLEILQSCGIDLCIPGEVCTVPALLQYLCDLRICHEYEVDLLCELLKRLGQHDLHQEVLAYAQSIMESNIVGYRVTEAAHNPAHLIILTVHNCPALTYGQVCKVKDILANLLGLDRHVFWLSSSESGSAVLGWGFGRGLAGGVHNRFSTESEHCRELVAVHNVVEVRVSLQGGGMESETVFSALASDSRPCTSASASETLPVSYLRNDAALSPSQPPLPMEEPHKTGNASVYYAPTKDKLYVQVRNESIQLVQQNTMWY